MKKKRALIIVDVQKDFCRDGALAVPGGDDVIEPLNWIIDYAAKSGWVIIFSRDWHPGSHGTWPLHCLQNTPGAEFHPGLDVSRATAIVSKGTAPGEDGFSGLEGRTQNGQALCELLENSGVEQVFIGGLATDYCVKATALDSAKLGFETYLLLDGCRAVNVNPDDEVKALKEMQSAGVIITLTKTVKFLPD